MKFRPFVLLAFFASGLPLAASANQLLSCQEAFPGSAALANKSYSTIELYPEHPLPRAVQAEMSQRKFTFDQLMKAFAEGYEADFNDPDQKVAFAIYRVKNLGDPKYDIKPDTISRIATEQKAHPDLAKPLFAPVLVHSTSDYLVRELSMTESPFRSCLGGDCATSSYLTKALQENYIYFTLTSTDGRAVSHGAVTVVLGSAKDANGKKIAVAFVDKIQHVPEEHVAEVLEAIRRSVANEKYVLSIPVGLGDHNGISNYANETAWIKKIPAYSEQALVLESFYPTRVDLTYRNEYSRAEQQLSVKPLLPLSNSTTQFQIKDKQKPLKISGIEYKSLLGDIYKLVSGDVDAKKRFVVVLSELRRLNFDIGDDYDRLTLELARDEQSPVPLKNLILTETVKSRRYDDVAARAEKLSGADQANLVQNWLQTPSLQPNLIARPEIFFKMSRGHLPTLLIIANRARLKNPKFLRTQLETLDLNDPFSIQTLRAISQLGDHDALVELSAQLPQILATLEKTNGKRARTLLQPIQDNLKKRVVVALDRNAKPATSQISISHGEYLPNGEFVRFGVRGSRDTESLQWFKNDQLVHDAKLTNTIMGHPGFTVTPKNEIVTVLGRELEFWSEGKVTKTLELPENIGHGRMTPGRLSDGSFIVGDSDGHMGRVFADGRTESSASDRVKRNFFRFGPLILKDDTVVIANAAGSYPGKSDLYWFRDGKQYASYPSTDASFALVELPDRVVVQATRGGNLNWFRDGKLLSSFQSGFNQLTEKTSIAKLSDGTVVMGVDQKVFWVKDGALIDVVHVEGNVDAVMKSNSSDEVTIHTTGKEIFVYKAPQKLIAE